MAAKYLSGQSMANPDIMDEAIRKQIIDEIRSSENQSRKRFEQRKFDVYRNRQAPYVLERLRQEFSEKTVQQMRKVLSINPCKRIVDQMGSIYAQEPMRNFTGLDDGKSKAKPKPLAPVDAPASTDGALDGGDDTETDDSELPEVSSGVDQKNEKEQALQDIYHYCEINPQMRLANRYYKLCDQAALYAVPKDGKVKVRALTPKDYDVVPDADDPEKAFAYILNVFDANFQGVKDAGVKEDSNRYMENSRANGKIADDSDRNALLERYVWWTVENHFTTNGKGEIVDAEPGDDGSNPIGMLPFVDIALEKDFQFFVKRGNNVAEFTIELLTELSDLSQIARLQGYSQAIIYSHEEPKDLTVGPNKVMWIKIPKDSQQSQPKFAFESPSPDLANSLEIINVKLKMLLSSLGLDATVVSGDTPKRAFTSGIDHLLANIDKFEASQEDIDLFRCVEEMLWKIIKAWLNAWNLVTGDQELIPELKEVGNIPDDIEFDIVYPEPAIVQTQTEKEDSVIKLWDNSLMTTKDAVKKLYEFDDQRAEDYMVELEQDRQKFQRPAVPTFGMPDASGKIAPAVGPDGKPMAAGAPGAPAPAPGKVPPNGGKPALPPKKGKPLQ